MGRWTDWWQGSAVAEIVESIRAGRDRLEGVAPRRLARFDVSMRSRSLTAPAWFATLFRVEPHHVRVVADRSGDLEAAGVILGAHPNGRVRQAALPLLEECSSPLAFGMLVLRANDWVDAVRDDAQRRLVRLVATTDPTRLVPVLPRLEQLAATPSRGAAFAGALLRTLTDRLSGPVLAAGIAAPDLEVRRSAARLLVDRGMAADAVEVALAQDDPATAWIVAEAAVQRRDSDALCARLMSARSARLRLLGLQHLIEGGGARTQEAALVGLLDFSPAIRTCAQAHLLGSGLDVQAFYRAALPSHPAAAILGLAETGGREEGSRILPYASHPHARVRAAAAAAVASLEPDSHRMTLLQLARDPSPRVARLAVSAIVSRHPTPAELDDLWSLVGRRPAAAIVPRVFGSLDRWLLLTYAFRGLASGQALDAGSTLLKRALGRWNASFTSPSSECARELAVLLPGVLRRLEPAEAEELAFTMKPFMPLP